MLPRAYRLQKNRQFHFVYAKGRSQGTKLCSLVQVRCNPPAQLRVGFSVSKKVGKAVVRNRTKRRMREIVQAELPSLRRGRMLIFVARPGAGEASFSDLSRDMRYLLRKADMYREKA